LLPLVAAQLQDGLREAREILQQLNVLATDEPGSAGATPEVAAAGAADAEEQRAEEEEDEEASGSEVGGAKHLWQHW
jgi:ribosomal protein L12E/L44/L45/RPP1/RPP2